MVRIYKFIKKMSKNRAFTFLEIALALIIISLLITTITVSKALRVSASQRVVIKEVESINLAVSNYFDSFNVLPGDNDVAYTFYPTECGSAAFCNGDNDSIIELYKESHLVWFHLKIAGYFEGNFSGQGDGDTQTQTKNVNVPASKFPGGQYSVLHYHEAEFPDQHLILLGAPRSGEIGNTALMDGNSAFSIDNKIDDGKPGTGNVYGRNGHNFSSTKCLIDETEANVLNTESIDADLDYDQNRSSRECIMGFRFSNKIGIDAVRTATD